MPALGSPSTWRTKPYTYQGYLYVDRPEILFQARVNQASFTFPLAQVTFDTVTTGAYTDVVGGLTVLFGSSAGADDLGRQRVRKAATSTILYFGESSIGDHDGEVVLIDNAYITVLNDRRIWTIPPRIDSSNVIYKDYDKPYTEGGRNYGSRPGPLAVGGCSKVGLVDPVSGVATFEFDSTDSIAITASATLSRTWDVGDGTITVGTASSTAITATFPAGRRYVTLTITDSNGDTHVRYILTVALDPDDATWYPLTDFEIVEHRLARDGASMTFVVHESIPATTFYDGVQVLYFEIENYGGTEGSLAGPSGDEAIKFVGWLDQEREEPTASELGIENGTELRCISTIERMRRINLLPQLVDSDSSPGDWTEMANLTTGRFLFYLLKWHSTVLDVADLILPDLDATITGWATTASNLLDQVAEVATERAKVFTCDQRGVLRVLDNPLLQDSGDRTSTVIISLTDADLISATVERDRSPRTYWLDIEGITTGSTADPLFAIAPGTAPGQAADRASFIRQLVANQTEINARGGHEYARINSPWLPLVLELVNAGDAGIEPALMEWVQVTLLSTSNERARSLSSERCLPMEVTFRHSNDESRLKECEISLFIETEGFPATTVIHPTSTMPEYPPFNFEFPPLPIFEWPGGIDSLNLHKGIGNIAGVNDDGYIYTTSDWSTPEAAGGPTWTRVAMGLTGTIQDFVVDPFSPLYFSGGSAVNGWVVTSSHIYYIEDMFSATPTVNDQHTFATALPSEAWRTITASFGNFFSGQAWVMAASYYRGTAGHTGMWAIYSQDGGSTWSSEVQISAYYNPTAGIGAGTPIYLSPKTGGRAYVNAFTSTADPAATDGFVSTDWGATWSQITNPDIQPGDNPIGCNHVPWPDNASEQLVYYGWHGSAPIRRKTKRVQGTTIVDISPNDGTRDYGPFRRQFGIRTYDSDRRFVVLVGYGNDVDSVENHDYFGVWVSSDYGDTWTNIVTPVIKTTSGKIMEAAFAGDTEQVLYLWGEDGSIYYSQDFGATIEDKRGNLLTDYPSIGEFIGIAGG